jgi:hypothetical protein
MSRMPDASAAQSFASMDESARMCLRGRMPPRQGPPWGRSGLGRVDVRRNHAGRQLKRTAEHQPR